MDDSAFRSAPGSPTGYPVGRGGEAYSSRPRYPVQYEDSLTADYFDGALDGSYRMHQSPFAPRSTYDRSRAGYDTDPGYGMDDLVTRYDHSNYIVNERPDIDI